MDDEIEKLLTEAAVGCFTILFRFSAKATVQIQQKYQCTSFASRPVFKLGTSVI
jgi:hypothetical protein